MVLCAVSTFADAKKPLVFVWLPNDSVPESQETRTAVGKLISDALGGREIVNKLTTDYNIAIEAIATNNAAFGMFGAMQYLQSHSKNPKIVPLVTNSGASGTMSDALYHSRICVRTTDAPQYQDGQSYSLDKIQGKRFAFMSNSSTSGFVFPSTGIVAFFSKKSAWSTLTPNDLIEGGEDKLLSQVVFGGSHQGSAAALLTERVEAAAFDDIDLVPYVNLLSGKESTPGAVYEVKKGAEAPFDTLAGKQFTVIWSVPVINGPICANQNLVTADELKKIVAAFCSDSTARNTSIFAPPDYKRPNKYGLGKQTGNVRFLPVTDATYQGVRDMIE
jgi:phosphonate transport system substrate-binding protein